MPHIHLIHARLLTLITDFLAFVTAVYHDAAYTPQSSSTVNDLISSITSHTYPSTKKDPGTTDIFVQRLNTNAAGRAPPDAPMPRFGQPVSSQPADQWTVNKLLAFTLQNTLSDFQSGAFLAMAANGGLLKQGI